MLLEYGLLGAVAVAATWAFWQEKKENNLLRDKRADDIVADRDSYRDALQDSTKAMDALAELIKVRIGGGS